MIRIFRWVVGKIWEKINLPAVYRELKELGKKHGKRFFYAALIWEIIEDGLFPFLSWLFGAPELIPLFLIFHFEPIGYPIIFWLFRMYDRSRGREPWEPDRSAYSSYWRSVNKVVVYKVAVTGWLVCILAGLGISPVALGFYVCLTALFGFVHERIWNDNNYGIRPDDTVEMKRVIAKTSTYRIVSLLTMYSILKASVGYTHWAELGLYQSLAVSLYLLLEVIWAKSCWGIIQNPCHKS